VTPHAIVPADERRHPADRDPWWGETWGFEFGAADASLGGFVQVTVYPRRNVAWFWAAVVGEDRRYVLCRDDDLAPPANPDVLEVRGVSLWSHAICETPLEHWTVAMEAYAVEMDDAYEAWTGERGDRIGLAFDLEWESLPSAAVRVATDPRVTRYEIPCVVNGVLQIGDETRTITYEGWRHHAWGRLDWSPAMLNGLRANGMGARPRTEWTDGTNHHTAGAAPRAGDWQMRTSTTDRRRIGYAPLLARTPDGSWARLLRTLDRVVSDGESAPGWSEERR
jgi:hypothetical protein